MAWVSMSPILLVVAFLTTAVVRRELHSAFMFYGILFSEVVNKVLKHTLRESRPDASNREDFGMPSDHAQVSQFFAMYY
eukprot:CAMPEP_0196664814 /NCGR_PEP_ID=MMETSP1086-20130531/58503_1 /TAXON_ID=77921 /ORGANISM="Cyanoptyche  gloeocystis , Strain SAG4.97" /LENGTH=78 /DNA_ID=CAMNT_0042001277 /DNA_START=123 /DNA_END=356 /DNA_ORIENTATION=+